MVRKNRFGIKLRYEQIDSEPAIGEDMIILSSYSKDIESWYVKRDVSDAVYERLTDIVYDRADVKNQQDMCNIIHAYMKNVI